MSNKALITRLPVPAPDPTRSSMLAVIEDAGVVIETDTPAGLLARGTEKQFEALEAAGYRVKLLEDTNLLRIGRYTIDVEADSEPAVPRELDVSDAELPG